MLRPFQHEFGNFEAVHAALPAFSARLGSMQARCEVVTIRLFVLSAFLLALSASVRADAQESSEAIRLVVGATKTITLDENPSTGFRWQINTAQSANLAAVSVKDLGYRRGSSQLIGAPGVHRWRIKGKAAGTARIVFDYARPWEHVAPAKRNIVRVEITRSR
jgi:inhibitor of cysteine peptidase